MRKIFRDNALELHVIDQEKIECDDRRFKECLEVIAGWRTNLDKLYELDNEFRLIVEYPTERYLEEIKGLDLGSEECEDKLCDIIEEIVLKKMEEEKIDFHKLHYELEVVEGITYEYSHITDEAYQ